VTRERVTHLDDPTWRRLFAGLSHSWFVLKTLQHYEHECSGVRHFVDTADVDNRLGRRQDLPGDQAYVSKTLQLVHIVLEPPNDYMRNQLTNYRRNAMAGEQVGIIPVRDGRWPIGLPQHRDFWLFDDREAWILLFEADGRFLAAERDVSEGRLEQLRHWRDQAWARATPVEEYLRRAG